MGLTGVDSAAQLVSMCVETASGQLELSGLENLQSMDNAMQALPRCSWNAAYPKRPALL